MKKLAIALGVVIVVLLGILVFYNPTKESTPPSTTTTPVASSTTSTIVVSLPSANTLINSPVGIIGSAPGSWFFEAIFPIKVLDGDGTFLGTGKAQAVGNWETTGTVPFSATIPFMVARYVTGTIVFMNDNPSGSPQNAKQFGLPVRFR